MFDIKESLKNLPDKPGVYLHKDASGEIIYVGKAASLRSRVRQYFQSSRNMDAKVRAMVSHIAEFEYITTNTEMEALILENTLIKKHYPRYNVLLRDDKTYPYIKVTLAEDFPRLFKTRILAEDGSKYFGPYADVRSANQIIGLLCDVYALKRCSTRKFPPGHRPCLNYHIGRCLGVCAGRVGKDEYRGAIDGVVAFLNGRSRELTDFLSARMESAAGRLDFEGAAVYRDYLRAAESVLEKQRVALMSGGDMDVVLAAKGERGAHAVVFFVRDGRLSGRESHHLSALPEDEPRDIVSAFVKQYYVNQNQIPKELLVEEELPDNALVEAWLSELRGGGVKVRAPRRGEKKALLDLARRDIRNVSLLLEEKARTQAEKDEALGAELLGLLGVGAAAGGGPEAATGEPAEGIGADAGEEAVVVGGAAASGGPEAGGGVIRVEAYDISNIAGTDSVGAMVVFEGTRPSRRDYRRFKIKTVEGADDYASMQEVVYRRLKRWEAGDPGFSALPDVILVDGGKGHVNAVSLVVRAMKLDLPVAGMVKDDRHRSRGLVFGEKEFDLKSNPLLYHFVGAVQEEAHRFAIDYHRGLRAKAMTRSELDAAPGIGPKRRNALLARFGGLDGIRAATDEELLGVPGMNKAAVDGLRGFLGAGQGDEL
ncbi:MAG: excinuclease ABC subunit UvrC [Clostridiales Family XIII bacterium]|jgi:excinuclease ABC subunit C|nr:excinuclease ABC subunit UvrC [Clostridiales Family XIII bacterium]